MQEDPPKPSKLILLPINSLPPRQVTQTTQFRQPLNSEEPPPEHLIGKAIEALLFTAPQPLLVEDIAQTLQLRQRVIHAKLRQIKKRIDSENHGFVLEEIASGWQFRTRAELGSWVAKIVETKPVRLSKAALEVLSIVAYRQPIVRTEIESLRGTNSSNIVRNLLELGLITRQGFKEVPGRPEQFATTDYFLELFGLRDLSELPTLRDIKDFDEKVSKGSDVNQSSQGSDKVNAPIPLFPLPQNP